MLVDAIVYVVSEYVTYGIGTTVFKANWNVHKCLFNGIQKSSLFCLEHTSLKTNKKKISGGNEISHKYWFEEI